MRITIRQLEIFRAIYQEQTVTGAARKIGLSQAATSQSLAELENLLAAARLATLEDPGGVADMRAALRVE